MTVAEKLRIAKVVQEEREACAKIAESDDVLDYEGGPYHTALKIAHTIRERGKCTPRYDPKMDAEY